MTRSALGDMLASEIWAAIGEALTAEGRRPAPSREKPLMESTESAVKNAYLRAGHQVLHGTVFKVFAAEITERAAVQEELNAKEATLQGRLTEARDTLDKLSVAGRGGSLELESLRIRARLRVVELEDELKMIRR